MLKAKVPGTVHQLISMATMKYAIIESGAVTNIAESSRALASNWVLADDTIHIGMLYDGSFHPAPPAPVVVPDQVTMAQARLALNAIGKLTAVDTAIASLPEPQKTQATIKWGYGSYVARNDPFTLELGAALGLTSAQIDSLFVAAAAIQ